MAKIAAVMIHVSDVEAGLSWYGQAFPLSHRSKTEDGTFEFLMFGTIQLEVVRADAKVGSGPCGTVVYWQVDDFDEAVQHFQRLGAVLYRGPLAIENNEKMCQVRDPWGNCIGLRGPARG